MTPITPLYSTTAHATGDGRNGHVQSDDGIVDLDVRMPAALGGGGGATNPEQLFDGRLRGGVHSALRLVAKQAAVDVTDSEVSATVHIGTTDAGGFGLAVEFDVSLPAAGREDAERVAELAHGVCPLHATVTTSPSPSVSSEHGGCGRTDQAAATLDRVERRRAVADRVEQRVVVGHDEHADPARPRAWPVRTCQILACVSGSRLAVNSSATR